MNGLSHNDWQEIQKITIPQISQPLTGTKYDESKPELYLLSTIAILKISRVLTYGKSKYGAFNWRKGFQFSRLISATLRHIFAWLGGESLDPETGISHLAHAAANLMFLLELEDTHPHLDDRDKK